MKPWVIDALISMAFAGVTSVIAKQGLAGTSAEMGIGVRTLFVTLFVMTFVAFSVPLEEVRTIRKDSLLWLAASAFTTAVSWVYYYKALKEGDVATVALIDKGSTVVAILLAWWLLKEAITLRIVIGAGLILLGLIVISRK
jgi:bacterial/archaeal transporter family protein